MSTLLDSLKNLETSGVPILDLGLQPLSNRFLEAEATSEAPRFPLELRLREEIGLVHTGRPFPVDELRPRYDWLTCFEPEDHLDGMVERILALPGITSESVFGAYSFKDDTTLRRLEKRGYTHTWRLDPVRDLGVTDPCANVETYQAVMTPQKARDLVASKGQADVLIVRHVIEHSHDLGGFIQAMQAMVKPEGYLVWELPDCARALEKGDCTTLWEEHTYYFTQGTFQALLEQIGEEIVHYESVHYPFENSLVAIVRPGKGKPGLSSQTLVQRELEISRARAFAAKVEARKQSLRPLLERFRREHGPIAMFGAGHLSVAYLSIMGVSDLIEFIVDDNPNKKGRQMPMGRLMIRGSDQLIEQNIKLCLLSLNPQNQPKVLARQEKFIQRGGLFASIFPGSERELEQVLAGDIHE